MATIMPYNGLYNVLTIDLTQANNGSEFDFFINPDGNTQDAYIGYVRVLRVDDACTISLGSASNDQIPMIEGAWFNLHYHLGISKIFVTNSASTKSGTVELQLLVTI